MLNKPYPDAALDAARQFVRAELPFGFTEREEEALRPFFSNLKNRIYFLSGLPSNMGASLLAMFSRMQNPRGLRGVFVDAFLPECLASYCKAIDAQYEGNPRRFLRENGIDSLDAFIAYSSETLRLYHGFVECAATDPEYMARFADSTKVRKFLSRWIDAYGHNSIARMASIWLGCESISLLAAKSLEWTRPGAGYIELSTRYVDMSANSWYPVNAEYLSGWGVDEERIISNFARCFELYNQLAGKNFDGPFAEYLRHTWQYLVPAEDLRAGVIGETCDVLGNLLPASTLTSVGVAISGESFPGMLKRLLLDATCENIALVELILEEAKKTGAIQFARHFEPTPWDRKHWRFLSVPTCMQRDSGQLVRAQREGKNFEFPYAAPLTFLAPSVADGILQAQFALYEHEHGDPNTFEELLKLRGYFQDRGEYDKLPSEFEAASVSFSGTMSFRGWRDAQRQGLCAHWRTLLTPHMGFYEYDKWAVKPFSALDEAFKEVAQRQREDYRYLQEKGVPPALCQYYLSLGFNVGFLMTANLRQWEFCSFQRTKWNVNHEVRAMFCSIERELRQALSWWARVSRADVTSKYIFARGKAPVKYPFSGAGSV